MLFDDSPYQRISEYSPEHLNNFDINKIIPIEISMPEEVSTPGINILQHLSFEKRKFSELKNSKNHFDFGGFIRRCSNAPIDKRVQSFNT